MSQIYKVAGKSVSKNGYGLMGFTSWGPKNTEAENIEIMKTALELGATSWNSGVFYGGYHPGADLTGNLKLLQKYFEKYPEDFDKICLSIKGGVTEDISPDGSKENIIKDIETALSFLPKAYLDIFCIARVDKKVGVEESVRAVVEQIKAGRVGTYCLSEVNGDTIKKAHAIHPVGAVEIEYSLFSREPLEIGVFKTCAELGIPVYAYSPLGGGYLTGKFDVSSLGGNDIRRHSDRFQEENMEKNKVVVEKVKSIAEKNGVSNAQIALEWVRLQSKKDSEHPVIIPIPGATSETRVRENFADVNIPDGDLKELDDFLKTFKRSGTRYNAHVEHTLLN